MSRAEVEKAIKHAAANHTVPRNSGRRASTFGEVAIAKALLHLADQLAGDERICGEQGAYMITVPIEIARRLPENMKFEAELTEDGILFRPVGQAPRVEPLPKWAQGPT